MTVIRSKKLRNAAKGKPCTLRFPGICNGDWETTVLCHVHDGRTGKALKADDTSGVHGCYACHTALDLHQTGLSSTDLYRTLLRALQETIRANVLDNVIIVQRDQKTQPKTIKRKPKGQRKKIQGAPFNRPPPNTRDIYEDLDQ